MLTESQINHLCMYHAPTDDQKARYYRIKAEETYVADTITTLHQNVHNRFNGTQVMETVTAKFYDRIAIDIKKLIVAIDINCPDSASKSAAIRCVLLVRNALNEVTAAFIACQERGDLFSRDWFEMVLSIARQELIKARWKANSSIALDGNELRNRV